MPLDGVRLVTPVRIGIAQLCQKVHPDGLIEHVGPTHWAPSIRSSGMFGDDNCSPTSCDLSLAGMWCVTGSPDDLTCDTCIAHYVAYAITHDEVQP